MAKRFFRLGKIADTGHCAIRLTAAFTTGYTGHHTNQLPGQNALGNRIFAANSDQITLICANIGDYCAKIIMICLQIIAKLAQGFNIGILKGSKVGIVQMLCDFQDKFCDILVWNKSQSMPLAFPSHAGVVGHMCELIFCFNQDGSRAFSHPQWEHGKQINRIDTENASGNEFAKQHAATFPVALPAEVIKSYTKTSVLDLCGGTGTTMVAAEQLDRICYMMEIDSHYCDVILARWEKLTGQTAELING